MRQQSASKTANVTCSQQRGPLLVLSRLLQYTKQRQSKPSYGLRDAVLIHWYTELARQYTSTRYNTWQGNATLLHQYEALAFDAGETRYSRSVDPYRAEAYLRQLAQSGIPGMAGPRNDE